MGLPLLLDQLYLGKNIPRLRTSELVGKDLDVNRLSQQYFLEDNKIPRVIKYELGSPPTDWNVIKKRQDLVRILMENTESLEELGEAAGMIQDANHGVGCLKTYAVHETPVETHPSFTYQRAFSILSQKLPQKGDYMVVHHALRELQEKTHLEEVVRDWNAVLDQGIPAMVSLKRVQVVGTEEPYKDKPIDVKELRKSTENNFKGIFDNISQSIAPAMEELYTILSFYFSIAKYGVALHKNGTPVVLPTIAEQPGFCDIQKFYNPYLGGLRTINFDEEGQAPVFGEGVLPHDYPATAEKVRIALGRNKGAKSTWTVGRGIVQLMAQMGSPIPAATATIGPVPSMGTLFVRQVDIGSGQSLFTKSLDTFGNMLETVGKGGLAILDDPSEGTDTLNAQKFMDFILARIHEREIYAAMATQDKRLHTENAFPHAAYYTTTPGSYKIQELNRGEAPEQKDWQEIARETKLAPYL